MYFIITKFVLSAGLIVLVSELAKRTERLGALLTALPVVALLSLVWLYVEKQPAEKIMNYSTLTFWYVLPTLPMFLIFPPLYARIGFWPALLGCLAFTALSIVFVAWVIRRFGIELL